MAGGSGVTVVSSGRGGRTVIRNGGIIIGNGSISMNSFGGRGVSVVSGGDVWVNGVRVSGSGDGVTVVGGGGTPRRARLQLPVGHTVASHDVKTVSGDTSLVEVNARRLRVSTTSGEIALRGAQVETVSLKTVSGDIEVSNASSANTVSLQSVSGDVDVAGGNAPGWQINTVSGDITTHGVRNVDASSVSGRTRVR